MLRFAEEGLGRFPRAEALIAARDVARERVPAGEELPGTETAQSAAPKQSWWRRAVNKITGKSAPVSTVPVADPADIQLLRVVNELALRATIVDRTTLMQLLRVTYASAEHIEGRVFAMVAALKDSPAIAALPSDQELIQLLRRELS